MINELKVQILEHFNKSDEENKDYGLSWYERAHNECLLLSQVFDVPLRNVIGVVAALSPNNKWNRNLYDAWNLLENPSMKTKVCTFKNQRRKALDILRGASNDLYITGILNGDKTCNFYRNILYYKTSQQVTVDTWAYRSVNMKPSKKNFKVVAEAYKQAAQELQLQPHQVQAVVWSVVRGAIA